MAEHSAGRAVVHSSATRINRIHHCAVIAALFLIGTLAALPMPAWSAGILSIDSAIWDNSRQRLVVSGTRDRGARVTLVNALDPGQTLGSDRGARSTDWSVTARRPSPVPCRVRAIALELAAELDVDGAPADCAPQPPAGNNDPVAIADSFATDEDSPLDIAAPGVLANDTDPDGDSLTVSASDTVSILGASVSVNADGSLVYDPSGSADLQNLNAGENLEDSFGYSISDGNGGSASTSVIIIVSGLDEPQVNAPPTLSNPGNQSNNEGESVSLQVSASDPDGDTLAYGSTGLPAGLAIDAGTGLISGTVEEGAAAASPYSVTLNVSDGTDTDAVSFSWQINGDTLVCVPSDLEISINSTSRNGCPDGTIPQVAQVPNNNYSILAINDLGMHCGDFDTRIASILPPFQAMLAQVIRKGTNPVINPEGVDLYYSATSNLKDPLLDPENPRNRISVFDGVKGDGSTYKTNFWDTVAKGTYDPFYPAFNPLNPEQTLTPLAGPPFNVGPDTGLPVPNVEHLYIGTDGVIGGSDVSLSAVLHAMPGIADAYRGNEPQLVEEHYTDKPFFINFPFGYVAEDVNWYEGAGIPFAAFDDNGRENAYPLVRVEAKIGDNTVSTVDTVLPISGEASCVSCHADPADLTAVTAKDSNSTEPTERLIAAELPVVTSIEDPDSDMPLRVSLEYAADINILRLHDYLHGEKYVTPVDNGVAEADPCTINGSDPDGSDSCLTNKALVQGKPVVCQVCHYTPALDLAQLGPLTGPEGTVANGRNHLHHKSNSNVMHSHHGKTGAFPAIEPPNQLADGTITNQADRLQQLEESCYLCHPGSNTQCLRGAMFNGGMLCSDCHGNMEQVGNDFTAGVSVNQPGPDAWQLSGNFYTDPTQPRVPWANEPGCGSCHTGDANSNLAGTTGTVVNTSDLEGNVDGIRLRQAFRTGDDKATPIVPANKRFAEPAVPADFNGTPNNGAGNPQLYRVSTGHGGVMCEGCHGATHAEWPNANPNANDNVAAKQLQGHTGTLIECNVCHNPGAFEDSGQHELTMNGPHGMHAVGSRTWNMKHKEARRNGGDNCRACHGQDGEGTVLSRMARDRVLECKDNKGSVCADEGPQLFEKGEMVGCGDCHQNPL